jgi:hypothetical protein
LNLEDTLPLIELIDEGRAIRGFLGSYCWNGICVDKLFPTKLKEISDRTILKKGSHISFKVTKISPPEDFQISIFKDATIVLGRNSPVLELILGQGRYVVGASAFWKGRGDVSYLFPIEVT